MMKIRVTVEVFDPTYTLLYESLPDNWETMTEPQRREFLNDVAMAYLANQAGAGAVVVEMDDRGNVVREIE
jgi:hypothetical protein